MNREEIEFVAGQDRCAAWLYPAAGRKRPRRRSWSWPTGSRARGATGWDRSPSASRRRGSTALVFDHRGFGDSGGEPDLFHPARQLEDWRAAIAHARSLPGIDPERVATFGSSMGGGNALAAAAADPRIAAAVSQVPFLDMVRQAHRSSPLVTARMLLAAVSRPTPAGGRPAARGGLHQRARRRGGLASGRRRSARTRAGATASPRAGCSAAPTDRSATRPGCTAPGCSVSARPTVSPSRDRRSRRRGGRRSGELRTYPGVDHFDIYDGPEFEAVVADEVAFLQAPPAGRRLRSVSSRSGRIPFRRSCWW